MRNNKVWALFCILAIFLTLSFSAMADTTVEVSTPSELINAVSEAKGQTTIVLTCDIEDSRTITLKNKKAKTAITITGGYTLGKTMLSQGTFVLDDLVVTDLTMDCNGKSTICTIAGSACVQNAFCEYGATGTIKLINNGQIKPYGIKIFGSKAKVTIENNGLIEGADRGLEMEDNLVSGRKYATSGTRTVVNNGTIRSPYGIGMFFTLWHKGLTAKVSGSGVISGGWMGALIRGAEKGSISIDNRIESDGAPLDETTPEYIELVNIIQVGIEEAKKIGTSGIVEGTPGTKEWVISGLKYCTSVGESFETVTYEDLRGCGVVVLVPDVLKKMSTQVTVKSAPTGAKENSFCNYPDRLGKKVSIAQ